MGLNEVTGERCAHSRGMAGEELGTGKFVA